MYAPAMAKKSTNGIKKLRGINNNLAMYGTSGRLRSSSMTLPKYMDMIIDQKTSGRSCISCGPGCRFRAMKAPKSTAVVPEPGIPKVSNGTKEPVLAALFAVSGAAKPLIEPLPNSLRSSGLARLRSTAYPKNEAIVAPVPGMTPIRNP